MPDVTGQTMNKPSPPGMARLVTAYAATHLRFSPLGIFSLILLSFLNGILQGVGFFMLVPLLDLVGRPDAGGTASGSGGRLIYKAFAALHIPVSLPGILAAFFVLISLAAMVQFFQTPLNQKVQRTYTGKLQTGFFTGIVYSHWQFAAGVSRAAATHLLSRDLPAVALGSFFFLRVLTGGILLVCYLFWAGTISIPLTLLAAGFSGAALLIVKWVLPRFIRSGKDVQTAGTHMMAQLLDHLSMLKAAKSAGVEEKELERFKTTVNNMTEQTLSLARQDAGLTFGVRIMAALLLCLTVYTGLAVLHLSLVSAGIAVLIFARMAPLISTLISHIHQIAGVIPSFEAAQNFEKAAAQAREPESSPGTPRLSLTKGIHLKTVDYAHPKEGEGPAFGIQNLSLVIPACQVTAICGPSGAGKSTLADLITGLCLPRNGTIEIDGCPLSFENLRAWRNSVGYVPQNSYLFNGTIRENILWANPKAGQNDLEQALALAGASALIRQLSSGLDTKIRDGGTRLSGGQRQRIVLARALIRDPQLIVLDEATSSLDPESQTAIFSALKTLSREKTIIFISHDSCPLEFADQVIHLENGRRVEDII